MAARITSGTIRPVVNFLGLYRILGRCDIPATYHERRIFNKILVNNISTCARRQDKSDGRVRIYTRTGDKGTSATFTGERRPKDDIVFQALGTIDELSAVIGLARVLARDAQHGYCSRLERLQCALQDLGSMVATPLPSARPAHLSRTGGSVPEDWVRELEVWVDEYTEQLPPLQNFILPGGGVASATLHLARTVCRRAERAVVPLTRAGDVDASVGIYLNRLSDFLFTVARVAAHADGVDEEIYVRPKPAS